MRFLYPAVFIILSLPVAAQRCPVTILPARAEAFARWINSIPVRQSLNTQAESVMRVPVIFHIVLNDDQLKDFDPTQVIAQLRVLNADYNRLNADTIRTPSEFAPVAGKLKIEFVPASQDPLGHPTCGVEIVSTMADGYYIKSNDGAAYKLLSSWPNDRYLNIWVININEPGNIGSSSFPDYILPGMPAPLDPRLDGVTIDFNVLGLTSGLYNRGRTLTHELVHYLGLLHIFDDTDNLGCLYTDYIDDTPPQDHSTSYCPPSPPPSCTTGINRMYQNYMDYTPDDCMNLFTVLQADRMKIVLQNARPGLINNPATRSLMNPPPIARISSPDYVTGLEPVLNTGFSVYQSGKTVIVSLSSSLSGSEVSLCNITGQIMQTARGSQEFNLSGASPGIYLIIIQGDGVRHVRRVLNW